MQSIPLGFGFYHDGGTGNRQPTKRFVPFLAVCWLFPSSFDKIGINGGQYFFQCFGVRLQSIGFAQLIEVLRFGGIAPRVASNFRFQFGLDVRNGGNTYTAQALCNMPTNLGFEGLGIGAVCGQTKHHFFKLGEHVVHAKNRQSPLVLGRRLVHGVIFGEFTKVRTVLQLFVQRFDLRLCVGFRRIFGVVHQQDVGRFHFVTSWATLHYLHQVVTVGRPNRHGDLSDGGGVGGCLKGINQLKCRKPTQVSVALRGVGIGRNFLCECAKIFSVDQPLANFQQIVVHPDGILRKGVFGQIQHDVGGVHVGLQALVGLFQNPGIGLLVREVRLHQLLVVGVVFLLKSRDLIFFHG